MTLLRRIRRADTGSSSCSGLPRLLGYHRQSEGGTETGVVEAPPMTVTAAFAYRRHGVRSAPIELDLALPWTYYLCHYVEGFLYVTKIAARPTPANSTNDILYLLPVPNSSLSGYVCTGGSYSRPNFDTDALAAPVRMIRAVNDFWSGTFTYQLTASTPAHEALFDLVGRHRTSVSSYEEQFVAPYRLWATWSPAEAAVMPWGLHSLAYLGKGGTLKTFAAPPGLKLLF